MLNDLRDDNRSTLSSAFSSSDFEFSHSVVLVVLDLYPFRSFEEFVEAFLLGLPLKKKSVIFPWLLSESRSEDLRPPRLFLRAGLLGSSSFCFLVGSTSLNDTVLFLDLRKQFSLKTLFSLSGSSLSDNWSLSALFIVGTLSCSGSVSSVVPASSSSLLVDTLLDLVLLVSRGISEFIPSATSPALFDRVRPDVFTCPS